MAVVEQRGSVTVASAVTEEEIPPKVSLFDGTSNKSLVGPAFCEEGGNIVVQMMVGGRNMDVYIYMQIMAHNAGSENFSGCLLTEDFTEFKYNQKDKQ